MKRPRSGLALKKAMSTKPTDTTARAPKLALNQYDVYKGHSGPVMGLHFHPLVGPVDFSDLFLTSSVDWTVKLWRAKSLAKPSTTQHAVAPIYSFDEADDYVYDVKWHPAHPASFGTVDGSGKFDLWNLNADTEVRLFATSLGPLFRIMDFAGACGIDECGLRSCDQQASMGS
jgi:WD40 repeat protein